MEGNPWTESQRIGAQDNLFANNKSGSKPLNRTTLSCKKCSRWA